MEFGEHEEKTPPQSTTEFVRAGSCDELSESVPLTSYQAIVQSLPTDSLGTSESMTDLRLSSLTPPTELTRATSTSPRLIHNPGKQSGNNENDEEYDDDMDGSVSPTYFPSSGRPTMSTSVPIDIPFPAGRFRDADYPPYTRTSTSVPNRSPLKTAMKSEKSSLGYNDGESCTRLNDDSRNDVRRVSDDRHMNSSRLSLRSSSIGRFRGSLFGSVLFGSPSRKSSTASIPRTNFVTEAMSIFPSFVADYSMESIPAEVEKHPDEHLIIKSTNQDYGGFDATASCTENLDHISEKEALDVAEDGHIAPDASLLKRSVSMPPKYEYHNQTIQKKFTIKEVPKEVASKDDVPGVQDRDETDDKVGELATTGSTPAKRKWQKTMPDLIEGPENETLTSQSSSRRLLAKAALAIVRGDYNVKTEVAVSDESNEELLQAECEKAERRKYKKNLFVLCTSFFFIFLAYLSLRNLQSSLNAAGGLGLYSLSCLYACFFIGCVFATTIVQRLRPKWSMLMCMCGMFLFDLVHFYPTFYTMIPTSGIVGFCLGVIWTAHSTYLANIAVSYAELTGQKIQDVLAKFNGMHFVFYQLAQIVGGLVSSVVLNSSKRSSPAAASINEYGGEYDGGNETFAELMTVAFDISSDNVTDFPLAIPTYARCGSNFCPFRAAARSNSTSDIDPTMVYMLVGIFTGCSFVGILILLLFLDRLEGVMKKSHATLGKQLLAVFKVYGDRKVICLVGIMFYSMLQSSFMFGEFTKSFVTCALGMHMIGYVMVCLSASSGTFSYINGRLQKVIGRCPLIIAALLLQSAMLVTLLLWQPNPAETIIFFIVVIFWGVSDGILVSQTVCLIGFLFSDNKEPAFAALKMTQSVALFSFFVTSPYLCTKVKVIIVLAFLVLALIGYVMLEVTLRIVNKTKKSSMLGVISVTDVKSILPQKNVKEIV